MERQNPGYLAENARSVCLGVKVSQVQILSARQMRCLRTLGTPEPAETRVQVFSLGSPFLGRWCIPEDFPCGRDDDGVAAVDETDQLCPGVTSTNPKEFELPCMSERDGSGLMQEQVTVLVRPRGPVLRS